MMIMEDGILILLKIQKGTKTELLNLMLLYNIEKNYQKGSFIAVDMQ